ncbi:MAG: O-antigen ligase family protein [Flavobacteriales bacterium]|nr:O-antigen ligase family protein [Flavobacteriales bacterium]
MKLSSERVFITGARISLAILFLFALIPIKWSGLMAGVLCLFSILTYATSDQRKTPTRSDLLFISVFIALPIFYLLELFWAEDVDYVWAILQRKMGLIIIPVAILFLKLSGHKIDHSKYFNLYILGILSLVTFTSISLLFMGLDSQQIKSGGYAFALRNKIEVVAGLHPTYFGLLVSFALLLMVIKISVAEASKFKLLWHTTLSLLLLVFLIALASRMAILSFLLGLGAILIVQKNKLKYKLGLMGIGLLTTLLLAFLLPSAQSRIMELSELGFNSTSMRYSIYDCSLFLTKEHWLSGLNVEYLQNNLNACYYVKSPELLIEGRDYNTHNEYLNVLLGKGILGLTILIGALVLFFRKSRHSLALVGFSVLVSCIFISENILERQIGVFFYALYGSLLFFFNPPFEPEQKIIKNALNRPRSRAKRDLEDKV